MRSSTALQRRTGSFEKRATEVESRGLATTPPALFLMQRRLRDLDVRQERMEQTLARVYLVLQELQDTVELMGGREEAPAFRLPDETRRPVRSLTWWRRMLYGLFAPWKLRAPGSEALQELPG